MAQSCGLNAELAPVMRPQAKLQPFYTLPEQQVKLPAIKDRPPSAGPKKTSKKGRRQ